MPHFLVTSPERFIFCETGQSEGKQMTTNNSTPAVVPAVVIRPSDPKIVERIKKEAEEKVRKAKQERDAIRMKAQEERLDRERRRNLAINAQGAKSPFGLDASVIEKLRAIRQQIAKQG